MGRDCEDGEGMKPTESGHDDGRGEIAPEGAASDGFTIVDTPIADETDHDGEGLTVDQWLAAATTDGGGSDGAAHRPEQGDRTAAEAPGQADDDDPDGEISDIMAELLAAAEDAEDKRADDPEDRDGDGADPPAGDGIELVVPDQPATPATGTRPDDDQAETDAQRGVSDEADASPAAEPADPGTAGPDSGASDAGGSDGGASDSVAADAPAAGDGHEDGDPSGEAVIAAPAPPTPPAPPTEPVRARATDTRSETGDSAATAAHDTAEADTGNTADTDTDTDADDTAHTDTDPGNTAHAHADAEAGDTADAEAGDTAHTDTDASDTAGTPADAGQDGGEGEATAVDSGMVTAVQPATPTPPTLPGTETVQRRRLPVAALAVAVLIGAYLLLTAAWGFDISRYRGEAMRGVQIAGIDVGGMNRTELTATVEQLTDELAKRPLEVVAGDTSIQTDPVTLGARLDTVRMVDEAMTARRGGLVPLRPITWLGRLAGTETVPTRYTVDPQITVAAADRVVGSQLDEPVEPALELRGSEMTVSPGAAGETIDADDIVQRLPDVIEAGEPYRLRLPTQAAEPVVDTAAVAELADEINDSTAEPIAVRVLDDQVEIEPTALKSWIDLVADGGEVDWAIDEERAIEELKPLFPTLGSEDQQAKFSVVDGEPIIIPASESVICCAPGAADELRRTVEAPIPPRGTDDEPATTRPARTASAPCGRPSWSRSSPTATRGLPSWSRWASSSWSAPSPPSTPAARTG